MKIDLPKITPNRGIEAATDARGIDAQKQVKEGPRPLFGDALRIQEKPKVSIDSLNEIDLAEVDFDEVEKQIDRDDALGKLLSSHLDWAPPDMPNFV